ncbi:muscle LIM protein Mlp84B-like isoform X2 [Diachasmimorpha longicaudata]|uniref:muscle LIM protein Mlp84B-like isoform X2 n=1 Tax=Diachasmimorpha longicaudata TaxID=58733 RepID=UPI0030B894D1
MPGICSRCFCKVYFAEEKLALGRVFHASCFSCRNCGKSLDSSSVTTYDDDLYCKKCYPKPKAVAHNFWSSIKQQRSDSGDSSDCAAPENFISKSDVEGKSGENSDCGAHASGEYSTSSLNELIYNPKRSTSLPDGNDLAKITPKALPKDPMTREVACHREESPEIVKNVDQEAVEEDQVKESRPIGEQRLRGGSGCHCGQNTLNRDPIIRHGCSWRTSKNCEPPPSCCKIDKCLEKSNNRRGCGSCSGGCAGGCGVSGFACLPLKPRPGAAQCCQRPVRCPARRNVFEKCSVTLPCRKSCDSHLRPAPDWQNAPANCECLGGGVDCQRCGLKVYRAEMQIASGVPYHNICFSCYCCRKPLETLTYHEHCGEIYCKRTTNFCQNFQSANGGYIQMLHTQFWTARIRLLWGTSNSNVNLVLIPHNLEYLGSLRQTNFNTQKIKNYIKLKYFTNSLDLLCHSQNKFRQFTKLTVMYNFLFSISLARALFSKIYYLQKFIKPLLVDIDHQ